MKRYARLPLVWLVLAALVAVIGLAAVPGSPSVAFQDATLTPSPQPTATLTPPPTNTPVPSWTPTPPAPTLVPPTSIPTLTPTPVQPASESGLDYAQDNRVLRVGTLYNAAPFSWLNENGEVVGYEPDILRAIAIELGVDVEFIQVTRQNADDMLLGQEVDLLIGQQVHSRDRNELFDFSHPYYVNQERMVVQTDAPYTELNQLAGQPVAVEIGSRSERALRNWSALTGVTFDIRTYFTESSALDALANGEVQGMLGTLDSLRRAGRQQMRLIDEPVLDEPYTIVIRRWDVNARNLINRSLQRLKASGRLDQIAGEWFPGQTLDFTTLVPVYDALYDDQRSLDDFPTDMPYPANPVQDRIDQKLPLRVAGLVPFGQDAPARVRIINMLNQALIEEMARRWGVQIEIVPDSVLNPVDFVANGQADIAVGVSPRWDGADRVEYSQPYIRHGNRLLVPANSRISTGFADMLGTGWWIGYFADEAGDAELITKFAEIFNVSQNINEPFAIQREQDAVFTMVAQNNVDAVFGDSLRLLALKREADDPDSVQLLSTPYGDDLPIAFAMPRNDVAFRALVNATLQDMTLDGTYQAYWSQHFGLGDPPSIPIWGPVGPDARVPEESSLTP